MRRLILPTIFAISFCIPVFAADPGIERNKWVEISTKVLADLNAASKKIGYPGGVAGIACDAHAKEVFMVVPDNGIYRAPIGTLDFERLDAAPITGRCETGGSIQMDPEGKRFACFMLDGKSAMTLDGGKTWSQLKQMGRGWDFASVDWSDRDAATILAMHHESGGQLYLSTNAGKSWNKFAQDKNFVAVGTFDAKTFITAKSSGAGGGISRTEDAGKTWKDVADFHVTSHVAITYNKKTYLLAKEGLLVSDDKGVTWKSKGAALEATFGPIFKDEKRMIVWGKKGIYETTNAGEEWKLILSYPDDFKKKFNIEWYTNVDWDPANDTFFLSHMGLPAYAWQR